MTIHVHIKRAYDPGDAGDGYRVFVDRLWPRGLSRQDLKFDAWCKDLAPTPGLRTWFGHKVEHWDAFRDSYESELRTAGQEKRMLDLIEAADQPTITLVYAAKDTEHNHALVLAAEMTRVFSAKHKKRKAP